jgi:xanthosine utilization system XapX-like protein
MINFGSPSQSQQGNAGMAVLAGLVVAIACALVWGVISYATKYEFSIMALLVGLAVGTVMARIGRVRTPAFGVVSALLAVLGCALGSLVAQILLINRDGFPLSYILAHLNVVFQNYPHYVGGLGFLFWVFAALYGYRIGMGGSMRWGWSRRVRPGQPYGAMNQPYGTTNQPYAPGQQPYGTPPGQPYGGPAQPYGTQPGQPYGTPPGQPGDASGQPYGAPPAFGGQQYGAPPAQAGDVTQQPPEFGFKQPPPGSGQ